MWWMSLIQGVLGVDSAIQESQFSKRQYNLNIQLANEAAADALQRGTREAGLARMEGGAAAARQLVAYTSSGIDASTGTAAAVIGASRANAELDAMTIENNAAREAWGYKKHGLEYQTQAGLSAARTGREIAGTTLGALGGAFEGYSNLQRNRRGGGR